MKFISVVLLALSASRAAEPGPVYVLPVSPLELVTHEEHFEPFARKIAADLERLLVATKANDVNRLKLLLGMRVHLALHFHDEQRALESAERIRLLQTDPGDRAHAGLTTRAVVAAWRETGVTDAQAIAPAFQRIFTKLLQDLPKEPAVRAALQRGRARAAAITAPALLDDVRQNIAPQWKRGKLSSLETADQLIRVRRRLLEVVPLRAAMLSAYDTALAGWPEGRN